MLRIFAPGLFCGLAFRGGGLALMPFVIDWVGVVAGVAGVALIYRVSTSRWFINQLFGAWAEWRTARALASRLRRKARIARGRIFTCAGVSAEADCVVATAHAVFVIETKWRGCRTVAGTAEGNEWKATYRRGRPFAFPNPLKQAERQAGVIRAVLAARGMDCPVYRSVVILGAGSLPSVTGVFGDPGKLAVWVERFDAQLGARASPASNATDALAVLIENSARARSRGSVISGDLGICAPRCVMRRCWERSFSGSFSSASRCIAVRSPTLRWMHWRRPRLSRQRHLWRSGP